MSDEVREQSFAERSESSEIAKLCRLAGRYKSECFIVGGIDEEAQRNNQLVIEAIEAAGQKLNPNQIFSINMGGVGLKV
jgi:hypothetical protein